MGENEKNFRGGEPLSEEALQRVAGGTGEPDFMSNDYAKVCHGYLPELEYMGAPSCGSCFNRNVACPKKQWEPGG